MEQTIREAYKLASSFLRGHGFVDAEFETELLMRRLLGVERARFLISWEERWPSSLGESLQAWLERRAQGEPLQYILGDQEFYGRLFCVNPAVLIPRPETELLVELVLNEADAIWKEKPIHVVDVGTGSGAIAVTLACERPHWQVTAIDISADALEVARSNAREHGVEERINWLCGEYLHPVLNALPEMSEVHILISNPPYIPSSVVPTLEKQVAHFEPHLALDGGEDGMNPYRVLTQQFSQLENLPRLICFEIGAEQGDAVAQMVREMPHCQRVMVKQDLAGLDRIVVGRLR